MDRTARWTRGDILRLLAIVLFAIAYRWYFLSGFMPPDSMAYTQYAYNVLDGSFTLDTPSWYVHRFTVFIPVAPIYALLGIGKHSTFAWPFLMSIGQILFVVWLGRRLFDTSTALLAALLLSLVPLDVIIAGRLVPDAIIATFSTLALGCWIAALEFRDRPHRLLLLLSGAFFCLAVFTRPYALMLGLCYLGFVLWRRISIRSILWTALGFAAVAAPVLLAYQLETGDPLYRLAVAKHLGEFFGKPSWQFTQYVSTLWNPLSPLALFAHLFVLGFAFAFFSRSHSRLLLIVWAVPFALFLQFGSMNLTKFVPITKSLRYLSPLFAPSALLAASVMLQVIPWLRRRLNASPAVDRMLLSAIVVTLAATSTFVLHRHQAPGRVWHDSSVEIAAVIRANPGLPVLSDHWRTGIRMAYFLKYEEGADFYRGIEDKVRVRQPGGFGDSRLGYAAWYPDVDSVPEALLVVDDSILRAARDQADDEGLYKGVRIPSHCYQPPASWELLKQAGDLRIYHTVPAR